jgi:hypothetical protein
VYFIPEAEFLDEFQTKVFKIFILAIHSCLYYGFYPPPPEQKWVETCFVVYCTYNVNIVYENIKSENPPKIYAQKPQRNCTFMNSASVLQVLMS